MFFLAIDFAAAKGAARGFTDENKRWLQPLDKKTLDLLSSDDDDDDEGDSEDEDMVRDQKISNEKTSISSGLKPVQSHDTLRS